MRGFEELPAQEATTQQVIHGDPKLDNMLFRNGIPFTLIDFDTLMEDSPWVDVGDLLRSVIGKRLTAGDRIDTDLLEQFSTTYHNNAHLAESADLSYRHAMQATARIATELAMRYLLDIYEEDYFSWDNKSFESRRDNHIPRIELQLNVAKLAVELAGN
jgi:Ser/Thr protein kinase RdoA (MazF antagonist)